MRRKLALVYEHLRSIGPDTSILILGTLIANAIPLALQPYLKRSFTPEMFGAFDVYLKVFNMLVALSTLKYENAIVVCKKESDARHALALSLLASAGISLILVIAIAVGGNLIQAKFPQFSMLTLWLLPFSVLGYSVALSTNMYFVRLKKFFLASTNRVARRASEGGVQCLTGALNISSGLIWGDVVGNLSQAIFSLWKTKRLISSFHFTLTRLRTIALEYADLPKYSLAPSILNTFVLGALTFLVLKNYSITEVGYLEFTQKILAIPSVFLSLAISQVVFQRVSALVNKRQRILPFIYSMITILTAVAILLLIFIQLYGQQLFVWIGGPNWRNSGLFAEILVYGSCIMLIFSPLGRVLIALRKFRINSMWEIGKFIAICSLFFVSSVPVLSYLKIYTILIIAFYAIYGVLIVSHSLKYERNLL